MKQRLMYQQKISKFISESEQRTVYHQNTQAEPQYWKLKDWMVVEHQEEGY